MGRERATSKWMPFHGWSSPTSLTEPEPEPRPVDMSPARWSDLDVLVQAEGRVIDAYSEEYESLLGTWDELLADLGKDPTHTNWSSFRPLRLSREEDWSDWLGFLLETSTRGVSAAYLFGEEVSNTEQWTRPRSLHREISSDGFRCDLVIEWRSGVFDHVEVKVGDMQLEKTFGTGVAMRSLFRAPRENWRNHVLLLDDQVPVWNALERAADEEPETGVLTWVQVSAALRRGLLAQEPPTWRAWAYAFVGCIEETLLGFRRHGGRSQRLDGVRAKTRALREGLPGE